ncbi:hypothetical protein [Alteromonas aestuariivivens]|nr:hypothetical protein [Alteromonas aestuariivivens]
MRTNHLHTERMQGEQARYSPEPVYLHTEVNKKVHYTRRQHEGFDSWVDQNWLPSLRAINDDTLMKEQELFTSPALEQALNWQCESLVAEQAHTNPGNLFSSWRKPGCSPDNPSDSRPEGFEVVKSDSGVHLICRNTDRLKGTPSHTQKCAMVPPHPVTLALYGNNPHCLPELNLEPDTSPFIVLPEIPTNPQPEYRRSKRRAQLSEMTV